MHVEPRLGVPTFLWKRQVSAQGGSRNGSDPEAAARAHLARHSQEYALNPAQLQTAAGQRGAGRRAAVSPAVSQIYNAGVHNTGKGAVIVRLRQRVQGIEVFRDESRIVMDQKLNLVAISGSLSGEDVIRQSGPHTLFQRTPAEAISSAFQDLLGAAVPAGALFRTHSRGEYDYYGVDPATLAQAKLRLLSPLRVKKTFFRLADRIEAGWYLEIDARPSGTRESFSYSYIYSAVNGSLLFRHDQSAHDSFSYRVWADAAAPHVPFAGPYGTGYSPWTSATDVLQPPALAPNLITLEHGPISTRDPWLPAGATETAGNNVNAYADLEAPDGLSSGDFRATTTGAKIFDYTYDFSQRTVVSDAQRKAAITQVFYTLNFLHDWFYDAGFNEAAGNAQHDNFGRGGEDGDRINAEVQDYSGLNNARMYTRADGGSPRLQVYVFGGSSGTVSVTGPGSYSATFAPTGVSDLGQRAFEVTGEVVYAGPGPVLACTGPVPGVNGKIALIDRGDCTFATKIANAQASGAVAVIIANNTSGLMNLGGTSGVITIPSLLILQTDGASLKAAIANGPVTATMSRADLDGALDNSVIAHEWGHYISNRLIGDANGLNTRMAGSLGEGWADLHALLMMVRPEDSSAPGNSQFDGVYPAAAYASGDYYFGLRRYPYSTDMSKNPLTFKHLSNVAALPDGIPVASDTDHTEVHNAGEIWATMLWECYAALLRDTLGTTPRLTFQGAQDRMKSYLVAAYKATPNDPTLLEARDALLSVVYANDAADGAAFWGAFAKRGAGVGAIAPDRYDTLNNGVEESYSTAGSLTLLSSAMTDTASCDQDGVLDAGEAGILTLNLKNDGASGLPPIEAAISSTNPRIVFPNGSAVTIPASAAYSTVTVNIPVRLTGRRSVGVQPADFQFLVSDDALFADVDLEAGFAANLDEVPAGSASEDFEGGNLLWIASSEAGGSGWGRVADTSTSHHVWGPDKPGAGGSYLDSPSLRVGSGPFKITFRHRYSFETDPNDSSFYDGGQILISSDGGETWQDIAAYADPGYNGTLFDGSGNPAGGEMAFTGRSAGYPDYATRTIDLGTQFSNKDVIISFAVFTDDAAGDDGWEIDDIQFEGLAGTPFTLVKPNEGHCVISWSNPADIFAGQALGASQLNATAGVPGTFAYTPAAGTVLPAGNGQALNTTFNPSDTTAFQSSAASVLINVKPRLASNVNWAAPAAVVYGTPLSAAQLNATANVPGSFQYSPVAGTVLSVGTHTLSVTFTPADSVRYAPATASVSLAVTKATPAISWSPAAITYNAALGAAQLNATANVAGTFAYTPAAGTVLPAGTHTLSVIFTPADVANYASATASAVLRVNKAGSTIAWRPGTITYGEALGGAQLNATANAAGTFAYTPAAGTVLPAGNHTLSVTFTPADPANYTGATASVVVLVARATPSIAWSPAAITYGAALGAAQLNATADVSGTFAYKPAAGTVLPAGNQTLSVTFTPADTANYAATTATTVLTVNKAAPPLLWSAPAAITYGTPLGAQQLNATSTEAGAFVYMPDAGVVLPAGNHTLRVTFTPSSPNYAIGSRTVTLAVAKAVPTIAWPAPAPISQGTALGAEQLNATANVPGVFVYTPAAGTKLAAGSQTLSVTFTPSSANYTAATASVTLQVNGPVLTSVVDSASFRSGPLGPDGLFSLFGSGLGETAAASTLPLPFTLGGTSLTITDQAGTHKVPLLYVCSRQINFVMPAGVTAGPITLTLTTTSGQTASLQLQSAAPAPALFTASMDGVGAPAGQVIRVAADGSQTVTPLAACSAGTCVPALIALGPGTGETYLAMYGTGIRSRPLDRIRVTAGSVPVEVTYAGPQGQFPGLDQINVHLPHSLAGRGEVDLVLSIDGTTANTVRLNLQ